MTTTSWTTVDELIAKLRARWARGVYLRAHAHSEPFTPIRLLVRSPSAADLVDHLDESLRWIERFDQANRTATNRQLFVVERQVRRSRALGDNPVPVRAQIDTLDQLCAVLGTTPDVQQLDRILEYTRNAEPELVDWVSNPPIDAIAHDGVWERVLTTTRWIVDHDLSDLDLRHLDAPGIDTKFVERHRKLLRQLLDRLLPADQIDPTSANFAGRYGFRARPTYVRFRLLTPVPQLPEVVTELELRVDELARLELPITTVFIVENQATYLAFPEVPDAIVVFGGGFGVTVLEGVPWLAQRDVVYWGDLDTHGFAILSRLRERVPTVRSILMDRSTLLAHREQFDVEPNPTEVELEALTRDEAELYRDLIEDRYGPAVRLEQERIRFSSVRSALEPWLHTRSGAVSPDVDPASPLS
ncbi:MAG: hypothetical protein IT195_13330 [Microthrixaceae bacterium]|nr:hypothetical protein [Microthrixaceae bacterium]